MLVVDLLVVCFFSYDVLYCVFVFILGGCGYVCWFSVILVWF